MNASELTVAQFLRNPTGPGSAVVPARQTIREDLERRFAKLASGGGFSYKAAWSGKIIVVHVVVPSEKHSVTFDVLLGLGPKPPGGGRPDQWTCKFFSNSPAFTFTYAYAADKGGFLLPAARKKASPESLKTAPEVRNPFQQLGFEKSVYFAMLWLRSNGLLETEEALAAGKSGGQGLVDSVSTSEKKLAEYRTAQAAASKEKKAAKAAAASPGKGGEEFGGVKKTKVVRPVKKTKKT